MQVTSKGQVTIPKAIRDRTGIGPGTQVEFTEHDGEISLRRVANPKAGLESNDPEFDAYLARVAGTMKLGMSTDEFMQLLRGE